VEVLEPAYLLTVAMSISLQGREIVAQEVVSSQQFRDNPAGSVSLPASGATTGKVVSSRKCRNDKMHNRKPV